jgi:2-phosphosulfolactate phosphatase
LDLHVHLLPDLVEPSRLTDSVAVVIDVLRATTSIVYALAAGCLDVRPCLDVDEARELANGMRAGRVILGGERGGRPLPGFDVGNSPREYTTAVCKNSSLVMTTTNGTRAILRAVEAERVLIAAFVNYSAVCEQLRGEKRAINIICAGTDGEPALEDTVLAGAIVDFLCEVGETRLNDSARMAWDCFELHGQVLEGALEISRGGENLISIGFGEDIRIAAQVDLFTLVPELRHEPLRIEIGTAGISKSHWPR